jgi:hypothetical protein
MTSRDFCYWLQWLFELGKPTELNAEQTELVRTHLGLVFIHEIDPSMGPPEHQAKLNAQHADGANPPKLEKRPPPWSHERPSDDVVFRC